MVVKGILNLLIFFILLPLLVAGQGVGEPGSTQAGPPSPGTVGSIFGSILSLLRWGVYIAMALALVYFLWGVAQYILASGDEDKKAYGRNVMIYGVIALFVMSAVWGLITVLKNTFIPGVSTTAHSLDLFPTFSD